MSLCELEHLLYRYGTFATTSFAPYWLICSPSRGLGNSGLDQSNVSLLICHLQLLPLHGVQLVGVLMPQVHHLAFIHIKLHSPLISQFTQLVQRTLQFGPVLRRVVTI